jgi:hypothetical protein
MITPANISALYGVVKLRAVVAKSNREALLYIPVMEWEFDQGEAGQQRCFALSASGGI